VRRPFRIYADTSVLGGCADPEFREDSSRFLDGVRAGRYTLLLTDVVLAELEDAPEEVRTRVMALPVKQVERVALTEEIIALRDA
jgi:hypothetical protein